MVVEILMFPNNNHLSDNGYTMDEEDSIYNRTLQDVLANPRWYLDNLPFLSEYRVSWQDYRKGRSPTLPHKYVRPHEKKQ